MKYGFFFDGERLCVTAIVSGPGLLAKDHPYEKAMIDTGAADACFPEEDLIAISAVKGLRRMVTVATGETRLTPTFRVTICLGTKADLTDLSMKQTWHKLMVESKTVEVFAMDSVLLGRSLLKRYKKVHVNWADQQVDEVEMA